MAATPVQVLLLNEQFMGEFYFRGNQEQTARQFLDQGHYRTAGHMVVKGSRTQAAEEVFDITNNPAREEERASLWGSQRSLSVGDCVRVGSELWLCASEGWSQVG